ncbi:MAG TPA: hypothetical protein QGF02_04215 [Candidatus Babeliales bacterium]|nr:hypothetical protein [Candidatus Babeliales bacterium]
MMVSSRLFTFLLGLLLVQSSLGGRYKFHQPHRSSTVVSDTAGYLSLFLISTMVTNIALECSGLKEKFKKELLAARQRQEAFQREEIAMHQKEEKLSRAVLIARSLQQRVDDNH